MVALPAVLLLKFTELCEITRSLADPVLKMLALPAVLLLLKFTTACGPALVMVALPAVLLLKFTAANSPVFMMVALPAVLVPEKDKVPVLEMVVVPPWMPTPVKVRLLPLVSNV